MGGGVKPTPQVALGLDEAAKSLAGERGAAPPAPRRCEVGPAGSRGRPGGGSPFPVVSADGLCWARFPASRQGRGEAARLSPLPPGASPPGAERGWPPQHPGVGAGEGKGRKGSERRRGRRQSLKSPFCAIRELWQLLGGTGDDSA